MAHGHEPIELSTSDQTPLRHLASPATRALLIVGVVALAVALLWTVVGGLWARFAYAYVVAFAFVLSLGLGTLFFVLVTHLFRAGWAVVVRRVAENFAATVPYLAIAFLPILVYAWSGTGVPFPWAQPLEVLQEKYDAAHYGEHHGEDHAAPAEHDAHAEPHAAADDVQITLVAAETVPHGEVHADYDEPEHGHVEAHPIPPEMIEGKRPYLHVGFFTLRWVLYFAVWGILGYFYWSQSIRQDHDGSLAATLDREKWAPVGLILFAVTITFAGIDLLMSLDPVWFSTMWGVYYFSGAFLGATAMLILTLMTLQGFGYAKAVTTEHYHDLGKLLFAFTFFWGYIAFSQYMLIWYGNIPEETLWFEHHGLTTVPEKMTGWTWVGLALLIGHLLIPFAGLLSRHVKRNRAALAFWAVWLLVFHAIDLWWIVMPSAPGHGLELPVLEVLLVVGLTALFLGGALYRAALHPLVPVRDPRLNESLAFENL